MNFNIIDGNDDYLTKLPAFVEAYNSNKLSIPELQQELNISNVRRLEACNWDKTQAARIKEEVIKEYPQ